MKQTITAQQRTINIINKALALGFEFEPSEKIEEVQFLAENFLADNTEAIEEECNVDGNGGKQIVTWGDGHGYHFESWGEILQYGHGYWEKDADEKIFHSTLVDSEGNVVRLYQLVGPTEYNTPDGFFYSKKEKAHLPYTYDVCFDDDDTSNSMGFSETMEYCKNYIAMHNGSNHSYFEDYKGGTVSVRCNETAENAFETEVL
jgi:hypothetical protein